MNTITINFIPCNPAPQGYRLMWRVAGSGDPYTDEGLFTESPIVFQDSLNPEGTCYEGVLQSDCSESGESGSVLGNAIPWSTPCEESGVGDYTISLSSPCVNMFSNLQIQGGTNGDVIKVRATFIGLLQKTSGSFTRADLFISSPDGTSDSTQSACFSDVSSHGFSITADSDITMTGPSTSVNVQAVAHNSSSSMSNVSIAIIEINGVPVNISTSGCKGSDSLGGTC